VASSASRSIALRIKDETDRFVEQLHSPEAAKAFKAFFEKRPPDFAQFT
jgi:hypothetical protein